MTLFFPQNYILPECKPEWNREAITVFFRLPSLRRLQATPPLQTSLVQGIFHVGSGETVLTNLCPVAHGDPTILTF
jgi:hypothetical protein